MKLSKKQQKILVVVLVAIIILVAVYQLGGFTMGQQKKYDGEDDANSDGTTVSDTFNGENIAQAVYSNLDGYTEYDVFIDTMNMLLALSNDELVIAYNEYTSLYGDSDYPTMRSNIMGEDLDNWIWKYPISGWSKVDEGNALRDNVIYRFDQLNLA